jgi:integrase/recombinase XerC
MDAPPTHALATAPASALATAHAAGWEPVLAAWLAQVGKRTGSTRTSAEYVAYVRRFLAMVPDPVTVTAAHAHAFAYAPGPSGKEPSASTVTVRLAALRSWFDFLRRAGFRPDNPCDDVRRPKAGAPTPRGLDADELRQLLAALPDDDRGRRDRAVIVTAVLTGLRRTEVLGMTRGSLDLRGDVAFYQVRTKGGTVRRRELPAPALAAIGAYWSGRGARLDALPAGERLFPISEPGFAAALKRHAARAGLAGVHVHALRHSSAKLRRDAGATLEDVQAHLGHANMATTARYLARLEGTRDTGWEGPAGALGLL